MNGQTWRDQHLLKSFYTKISKWKFILIIGRLSALDREIVGTSTQSSQLSKMKRTKIVDIHFNSSSHTRFDKSGLLKFQTLLRVRQGQHKNFLLQWLFYIELLGWDMAQNVNLRQFTAKNENWENWEVMIFFERWWP